MSSVDTLPIYAGVLDTLIATLDWADIARV
jgi:hypothetical protein